MCRQLSRRFLLASPAELGSRKNILVFECKAIGLKLFYVLARILLDHGIYKPCRPVWAASINWLEMAGKGLTPV